MAKWNRRNILWVVVGLIIVFPIVNFYLTPELPEKIRVEIMNMQAKDDMAFVKMAYDDIGARFNSKEKCWRDEYRKNYLTNGESIFELEGECLPCHIQNNLLRAYLLESGRFEESQLVTKTTVCWEVPMFHVYLEVHLDNGTILNVDTWGNEWGIPFGATIEETEVCDK